jgi:D-alanyl-D-alanine carboxypeptidase
MDVTGLDGRCPAEDCFAGTPEARWLAAHAHERGFVIRYPEGKEAVTGYDYEPWHLRYVGPAVAAELTRRGLTLDELAG